MLKPAHMAKMAVLKHVSKMMDHAMGSKMKSKPVAMHAEIDMQKVPKDANGIPQQHEMAPMVDSADKMEIEPKSDQSGEMMLEQMPGEEQHPHDVLESDEDKKLLHHMYSQLK